MVGEDQLEVGPAQPAQLLGLGLDLHLRLARPRARDRRMLLALDLDDAHPARPEAGQLGLVAEGRDLDPVVAADLEDRLALEALDDPAVDLDPDARRRLRALRRLRVEQPVGQRDPRSVARRLSGRVIRSAMGRLIGSHRPPPRSDGRRRQGRHCAGCARPARTGSIASRWTAGGSSAARGRTARRPRCRPTGPRAAAGRSGRGRPSTTRSAISTSRRVPIRHGIVLPHASPAQNRVSSRARSTMQARSSATTTEPEPMCAPAARSESKSYGVSSRSGGSRPPDGPPTRTALMRAAAGQLARRAR